MGYTYETSFYSEICDMESPNFKLHNNISGENLTWIFLLKIIISSNFLCFKACDCFSRGRCSR